MEQDTKNEGEISTELEHKEAETLVEEDKMKDAKSTGEQADDRKGEDSRGEQKDYGKEASPGEQEDTRKKADSPEKVDNRKEAEFSAEQKTNKTDSEIPSEMLKVDSSKRRSSKLLKAKSEIIKKSPAGRSLIPKKGGGSSPKVQLKRRNKKNKSSLQEDKESIKNEQDVEKLNSMEDNKNNVPKVEHNDKSHQTHTKQENIGQSGKSHWKQKHEETVGASDKRTNNPKNKEKLGRLQKDQRNERKKEKLGGLIFMCSAKTKPDCFHYRVMGVSAGKTDLVMGVKPGLKLFLYDFHLKLLYGIYKASSAGGIKLEPKAFRGAFPAQVRFSVVKDCFPLPESIFKKAIKENYYEKNKFKTELTDKQVRNLTELFRPAEFHSIERPVRSPPRRSIRNREIFEGERDSWSRDPYASDNLRNYELLSSERGQQTDYREVVPRLKEEISYELYPSEKEYRAFGLRRDRYSDPTSHHPLETREKDFESEYRLRHANPIIRDNVSSQREAIRGDPLFLNVKDYHDYSLRSIPELSPAAGRSSIGLEESYDPSYSARQYGPSLVDTYLPPPRRDEDPLTSYSIGGGNYTVRPDGLQRRETEQADRFSSKYAADSLLYYNQTQQRHDTKLETTAMPVSSRYSFAGPSFSYL